MILLSNSQSLGNKMDEVNIIFDQEKVDIGVLSESWLTPKWTLGKQISRIIQFSLKAALIVDGEV